MIKATESSTGFPPFAMLQTLCSRCNITYFAQTIHGEVNNWKSNDYRREKRCHFTPLFIFIRLSVKRLNSRAGKVRRILYSDWRLEQARWAYLARSWFRRVVLQEKILFWPWHNSFPHSSESKTATGICLFLDRGNKNFKRRESLNIVLLVPKSVRAFIK